MHDPGLGVYVFLKRNLFEFYFFPPVTLSSNGPNSEALLGLHTRVLHKKPVSLTTSTKHVRIPSQFVCYCYSVIGLAVSKNF